MLSLKRRPGERILIFLKPRPSIRNLWFLLGGGEPEQVITILIKDLQYGQADLGFVADPKLYRIDREEVAARISREGPRRPGPRGTGRKLRRSIAALAQGIMQSLFRHFLSIRFPLPASP